MGHLFLSEITLLKSKKGNPVTISDTLVATRKIEATRNFLLRFSNYKVVSIHTKLVQ